MANTVKRMSQTLKRAIQFPRLVKYAAMDLGRFWRHASLSAFDSTRAQISARIMYNVHALEKGLAQSEDWMPERGRKALANLNLSMLEYIRRGYPLESFEIIQGASIIACYRDRHESAGHDASFVDATIDASLRNIAGGLEAGVKTVKQQSKADNAQKTFYELCQGRSSVRSFSGEPVEGQKVKRALENAEKTPSVCNRQGWGVYWTENEQLIAEVLELQRGFHYRQLPSILLTITVSSSTFVSPVERNQGYIDGGLYSMSLLYGLEAEGLAAVPLNACLYSRDRKKIHSLLKIGPSEEIVMFIAVGQHKESSIVPTSARRPTEVFLRVRD